MIPWQTTTIQYRQTQPLVFGVSQEFSRKLQVELTDRIVRGLQTELPDKIVYGLIQHELQATNPLLTPEHKYIVRGKGELTWNEQEGNLAYQPTAHRFNPMDTYLCKDPKGNQVYRVETDRKTSGAWPFFSQRTNSSSSGGW